MINSLQRFYGSYVLYRQRQSPITIKSPLKVNVFQFLSEFILFQLVLRFCREDATYNDEKLEKFYASLGNLSQFKSSTNSTFMEDLDTNLTTRESVITLTPKNESKEYTCERLAFSSKFRFKFYSVINGMESLKFLFGFGQCIPSSFPCL